MKDLKSNNSYYFWKRYIRTNDFILNLKESGRFLPSYGIIYSCCNNRPATLDCFGTIKQKQEVRHGDLITHVSACLHVWRPDPYCRNRRAEERPTHHPRKDSQDKLEFPGWRPCRRLKALMRPVPLRLHKPAGWKDQPVPQKSNNSTLPLGPSLLSISSSVAYWVAEMKNCTIFDFSSTSLWNSLNSNNVTKHDLGLGPNHENSWRSRSLLWMKVTW